MCISKKIGRTSKIGQFQSVNKIVGFENLAFLRFDILRIVFRFRRFENFQT